MEEQARASLRQELSQLRKNLPEGVLSTDRQSVWLDQDLVAVQNDRKGELLEGFDLKSEGFEDWLREARSANAPDPSADPDEHGTPVFASRPAVLLYSFEALSNAPDDEMIAAGLAADLKTTLSYWRRFPVIGPEAIGWKTAKELDLRSAAELVKAVYAITGTTRCLGGKLKITVDLSETENGRLLWSQQFEGTLEDIFNFQEEVSRAIVAQIEPQLSHAEATRIERTRPKSIGPWQLLAQADDIDRKRGEAYGTIESNQEQVELMDKALEIQPDFAPALARKARVHFREGLLSWVEDRAVSYANALELCKRALEIDPENWEAHAFSGLVNIFGYHNYELGAYHGSEAIRLNPSATIARQACGCSLEWIGKPEEALEHLYFIFRLDPSYVGRAAVLGDITTCEMFLGNREASLDAARQLFAISADYARGLQRCVSTFGFFGEQEPAQDALARLKQLQPDFDTNYVRETYPYAREQDLDTILTGFSNAGAFQD
ncbi:hypothetical protein [Aliiroseovarius sp. PrR006]|uniref:hypothetical protein n=1 Tax=Aliiroseovarius sp. PrR006 TaxID=2706883 RepID=UPI0013D5CA0B|nr:hypothetical protein [Aliiroseovarius sp. PrR006]NDW53916.1 hypothetical protein [Aliiroseovarius sp. PrR006]